MLFLNNAHNTGGGGGKGGGELTSLDLIRRSRVVIVAEGPG